MSAYDPKRKTRPRSLVEGLKAFAGARLGSLCDGNAVDGHSGVGRGHPIAASRTNRATTYIPPFEQRPVPAFEHCERRRIT